MLDVKRLILAIWILAVAPAYARAAEPNPAEAVAAALAAAAGSERSDARFPIGYLAAQERRARTCEAIRSLPVPQQQTALSALVAQLKSRNWPDRAHAAMVLGGLRELSAPFERQILEALKTPDLETQTQAAQALAAARSTQPAGSASAFGEVLAPHLAQELASSDMRTRTRALVTISLLGNQAASMGPVVVRLLRDPEPSVRAAAAQTLGSLSDQYRNSAPALLPLIHDPNSWVRSAAILSLGKMREFARPAAPAIVQALKAKESEVREAARNALGEMRDSSVAPALAGLLSEREEPSVRAQAAEALARMGESAKGALAELTRVATESDSDAQRNALWALSALGASARPALEPLSRQLKSKDAVARKGAALALGRLIAGDAVAQVLLEDADDPDPEVQNALAQSLSGLGGMAKGSLPKLTGMLSDPRAETRRLAAVALSRMGSVAAETRPKLLEMAKKDPDLETRLVAIQALGTVRETSGGGGAPGASDSASAELIELLKNPEPRIKQAALTALQFAPNAQALPDATAALSDPAPQVREAAVGLLANLGARSAPAFPKIVALLKDGEITVSRRVVSAMSQLGPHLSEPQVLAIGKLAGDTHQSEPIRLSAIQALCRLEKYASPAEPALVAVFERKTEPERLRSHAAFALRIVGFADGTPARLRDQVDALLKAKKEYFQGIDF